MKKLILSAVLFLGFALINLSAQPKLEIIGGDTYDWGDVKPIQSPIKTKIKLKNVGNAELNISNVKPGCGCTTAPLDKSKLKPGEEATLDVSLRISGYNGHVTKSIRITSNDKDHPTQLLWLKCNVIRDIQILPNKYLNFQQMTIGYPSEAKVSIKNNSKENITLSDFTTKPESMTINLKGKVLLKPGESVELKAKYTAEKLGSFRGNITMKTTNKENKILSLTAFGRGKKSPIFNEKPKNSK